MVSREPKQNPKKEKFFDTLTDIKKSANIEKFLIHLQTHTLDTVAYLLLLVGIIWSFFHGYYGGALVGIIVGFYFSKELVNKIKSINALIEKIGISKSIVLSALFITFFINAPTVFLGMIVGASIKQIIKGD